MVLEIILGVVALGSFGVLCKVFHDQSVTMREQNRVILAGQLARTDAVSNRIATAGTVHSFMNEPEEPPTKDKVEDDEDGWEPVSSC